MIFDKVYPLHIAVQGVCGIKVPLPTTKFACRGVQMADLSAVLHFGRNFFVYVIVYRVVY